LDYCKRTITGAFDIYTSRGKALTKDRLAKGAHRSPNAILVQLSNCHVE